MLLDIGEECRHPTSLLKGEDKTMMLRKIPYVRASDSITNKSQVHVELGLSRQLVDTFRSLDTMYAAIQKAIL